MYTVKCLNPIASKGLDLFTEDFKVIDDLDKADAVLVRSAAMHDLTVPESLLAVARAGAGVNNIPLDEYAKKGIVAFNTPGANANGVKELVFAGMLYASRDIKRKKYRSYRTWSNRCFSSKYLQSSWNESLWI